MDSPISKNIAYPYGRRRVGVNELAGANDLSKEDMLFLLFIIISKVQIKLINHKRMSNFYKNVTFCYVV